MPLDPTGDAEDVLSWCDDDDDDEHDDENDDGSVHHHVHYQNRGALLFHVRFKCAVRPDWNLQNSRYATTIQQYPLRRPNHPREIPKVLEVGDRLSLKRSYGVLGPTYF